MKLVIEISEHNKSVIDNYVEGSGYNYKELTRTSIIESLAQAVHKGMVLKREHGRLVDADEIEKRLYELAGNGDMIFIDAVIDDVIGNAETIDPKIIMCNDCKYYRYERTGISGTITFKEFVEKPKDGNK